MSASPPKPPLLVKGRGKGKPVVAATPEKRLDPSLDDGNLYTYDELEKLYITVENPATGQAFTVAEIQQYWEDTCYDPVKKDGVRQRALAPTVDTHFATYIDMRMRERRTSRLDAISDLCRLALVKDGESLPDVEQLCAVKRAEWEANDTLAKQRDYKNEYELHRHVEVMLALYVNTLQHIPLYRAWRLATQWTADRMAPEGKDAGAAFEASIKWMTWLDQGLALLPTTHTPAWRVAVGFRYDDLLTRFAKGSEVIWYEPKSVTLSVNVARSYAQQGAAGSTLFYIENCQGHDISFLSHFPHEHEVMTRAVTRFVVKEIQFADLSSGDPLERCDRVVLIQQSMKRREPVTCTELSAEDVTKYSQHLQCMKAVELYTENFDIRWHARKGITQAELGNAYAANNIMDGFAIPAGRSGIDLVKHSDRQGIDSVSHSTKFMMFTKDVNDEFNWIACSATQKASFRMDEFTRQMQALANSHRRAIKEDSSQMTSILDAERKKVWDDKYFFTKMWYWSSSWDSFDRIHDMGGASDAVVKSRADSKAGSDMSAQRQRECNTAFENCLAGFILSEAIRTKRIMPDPDRRDSYDLVP